MTTLLKKKINCDCGSIISPASIFGHKKSKRHLNFIENGKTYNKITSSSEYQKMRFNNNPHLRQIQRTLCKNYYILNKSAIQERHSLNRKKKKDIVSI